MGDNLRRARVVAEVPSPIPRLVTARLLVMTFSEGIPLKSRAQLLAAGIDLQFLTLTLTLALALALALTLTLALALTLTVTRHRPAPPRRARVRGLGTADVHRRLLQRRPTPRQPARP